MTFEADAGAKINDAVPVVEGTGSVEGPLRLPLLDDGTVACIVSGVETRSVWGTDVTIADDVEKTTCYKKCM